MSPHSHTVGVFDSGVGGLSVLRALVNELPSAHFIYVADSAYAPYGERTADEVTERSQRITAQLRREYPLDTLVVACNTATAHAIDALRLAHHDLPFVGVEPALKPAAALSQTRHIGVMATRGTLESARFKRLRSRLEEHHGAPTHFHVQPCDGLADAIERGDEALTQALCERYVGQLQAEVPADSEMDTLVLGCTHYPFAAERLHQLCGPGVHLVDTGAPVARRTREVLHERALARHPAPAQIELLSTGNPQALDMVAQRWLGLLNPARAWVC